MTDKKEAQQGYSELGRAGMPPILLGLAEDRRIKAPVLQRQPAEPINLINAIRPSSIRNAALTQLMRGNGGRVLFEISGSRAMRRMIERETRKMERQAARSEAQASKMKGTK